MSSEELSIKVDGLGKRYEIYAKPADRLKQMILPRLARVTHRAPRAYYNEFWALRGVNFTVRRGETVGIIGRNGSGKSTLLQMICSTLNPTEGQVTVNGRIAALLELGAGFNPEFTGEENVYLSGLLYGIPEATLRERFDAIVQFADIGDFIGRPVKTYSSGMYVRLAFAIAAHVDADILVVDEALSVGDVRFGQKCMRFLRKFQEHGTLLFVSHDSGAVINLCSRAIWLDGGKQMMDGTAREVVEHYLAAQHAADRAALGDAVALTKPESQDEVEPPRGDVMPKEVLDPRLPILNGTGAQRNLIEVFEFDPDEVNSEFGAGAARITGVSLVDGDGVPHKVVAGGEAVDLCIEAVVQDELDAPIFGFYVKDRLGQRIFGDNSYVTYHDHAIRAARGSILKAHFHFRMPILPTGDYSVDVALATGTQVDHTQQHWIYDAINFKASEGTMRFGLVGIPMHRINIEVMEVG